MNKNLQPSFWRCALVKLIGHFLGKEFARRQHGLEMCHDPFGMCFDETDWPF